MPTDKACLIERIDELIDAQITAREHGLCLDKSTHEKHFKAWESAKHKLAQGFVEYARVYHLSEALLNRWLDVLSNGDKVIRRKRRGPPADQNPMLIRGRGTHPPPPPSSTLTSVHEPTSNLRDPETLGKPTDVLVIDAAGWFGGLELANLHALRAEIEGLPDERPPSGQEEDPLCGNTSMAIKVDETTQTILFNNEKFRFTGRELWDAFHALWKAKGATVDLQKLAGRKGAEVAADLRKHLKKMGLKKLAADIKCQQSVGYYLDLPG